MLTNDLKDILERSVFRSFRFEKSLFDKNLKPKNKAHERVLFWEYFSSEIEYNGRRYEVIFNIRDKGDLQYIYLIEVKDK